MPHGHSKKERRDYYRGVQASFPAEFYTDWNKKLAVHLRELISSVPKGSLIALYKARAKEASLDSLFALPYRFAFPRVLEKNGKMEFRLVENPLQEDPFEPGPWGILEPRRDLPLVSKEEFAAVFVPLLAFDGRGMRLGHGKGFYDRFLAGFRGKRFGAAFEWQFSQENLPTEDCDEHLHAVATEYKVYRY